MMPPVFGTFSLPAHRDRIGSRSSGCRMMRVNSRQPREYPQLDVGWSARSLIVPSLLVQVVRCRGRINPMTDKGWSVLMPVKVLAEAKSRLAGLAGLSGPRRAELALALASDTVTAGRRARAVSPVVGR